MCPGSLRVRCVHAHVRECGVLTAFPVFALFLIPDQSTIVFFGLKFPLMEFGIPVAEQLLIIFDTSLLWVKDLPAGSLCLWAVRPSLQNSTFLYQCLCLA